MDQFQSYKTFPLTVEQIKAFSKLVVEAREAKARAEGYAEGLMKGALKFLHSERGLPDGAWQLSPDGTMLMCFGAPELPVDPIHELASER